MKTTNIKAMLGGYAIFIFCRRTSKNLKVGFNWKKGPVPTVFMSPQNPHSNELDPVNDCETEQLNDSEVTCENCSLLMLESKELKSASFKIRIDLELRLQRRDFEIKRLENRCTDLSKGISSLKEKIKDLEKKAADKEKSYVEYSLIDVIWFIVLWWFTYIF